VIGQADPGAQVGVIGFNADSSWVNVRLEDGSEGWISSTLLRINPLEEGALISPKNTFAKTSTSNQPAYPVFQMKVKIGNVGADAVRPKGAQPCAPTINTICRSQSALEGVQGQTRAKPLAQDEEPPTRTPTDDPAAAETNESAATSDASNTPRPTRTPRPTITPTAVPFEITLPEINITLPELTFDPDVDADDLEQGRYYAINLGIIVSVAIIAAGAIINIVRAVLRRSRRN
jgi:hypothetical protein